MTSQVLFEQNVGSSLVLQIKHVLTEKIQIFLTFPPQNMVLEINFQKWLVFKNIWWRISRFNPKIFISHFKCPKKAGLTHHHTKWGVRFWIWNKIQVIFPTGFQETTWNLGDLYRRKLGLKVHISNDFGENTNFLVELYVKQHYFWFWNRVFKK